MNEKLVFLDILFLVGLTLSGCVTVGGYSYGHYGYPYSYGYYNYGYRHPYEYYHPRRDWDDRHHGSGHGSRHWR
jgi:hypothetical protein